MFQALGFQRVLGAPGFRIQDLHAHLEGNFSSSDTQALRKSCRCTEGVAP